MRVMSFIIIAISLLSVRCARVTPYTFHNDMEGTLANDLIIDTIIEKVFELDSLSAPRPTCVMVQDNDSLTVFSFLNEYSRTIYQYNYNTGQALRAISLSSDLKELVHPRGYIFLSDSIYHIYDMAKMKLLKYKVNTNKPISEIEIKGDKMDDWPNRYPQFMPTGSNPLRLIDGKILMMGQSFKSIPQNMVEHFPSGVLVDISNETIEYDYYYPKDVYGEDSNWEGGLQTSVYLAKLPDGRDILSYPPSHNVLVLENSHGIWKYGGSNNASTISSIPKSVGNTNEEDIRNNYIRQTMYGPILYDSYRDLIYRFVSFPIAHDDINMRVDEKNVGIIVFKNNLEYLGEVLLGKIQDWNWNNSFVTKEGLNIEYVTDNEDCIIFKTLSFRKI